MRCICAKSDYPQYKKKKKFLHTDTITSSHPLGKSSKSNSIILYFRQSGRFKIIESHEVPNWQIAFKINIVIKVEIEIVTHFTKIIIQRTRNNLGSVLITIIQDI